MVTRVKGVVAKENRALGIGQDHPAILEGVTLQSSLAVALQQGHDGPPEDPGVKQTPPFPAKAKLAKAEPARVAEQDGPEVVLFPKSLSLGGCSLSHKDQFYPWRAFERPEPGRLLTAEDSAEVTEPDD